MTSIKFHYAESIPVWYNGCYFHSLLELKYVLSIEAEFHYIREPVVIPYDPRTKLLPAGWGANHQFYIPDLLIRHKQTNEAFLVEIKPGNFSEHDALEKRQRLSKAFICKQQVDWKYMLVQEDLIALTEPQKIKLQLIKDESPRNKPYVRSFYSIVPEENGTRLSKSDYVYMVKNGKTRIASKLSQAILYEHGIKRMRSWRPRWIRQKCTKDYGIN